MSDKLAPCPNDIRSPCVLPWGHRGPCQSREMARLAEAEALLEIVAPLAYAQWKSGSCGSVEAVVGLNEPITGIADSADDGLLHDRIGPASGKLISASPLVSPNRSPCRSPYCECSPGQCSHPGCYDARATVTVPATDSAAGCRHGVINKRSPTDITCGLCGADLSRAAATVSAVDQQSGAQHE